MALRDVNNSRWLFASLSVAACGYAFVGAWLVTSGPSDPIDHTAQFLAFLVSPWMLGTYLVAVALILFGAWYLQSGRKRAVVTPDIEAAMRRQAVILAIVLLVVAASLSGIGILYVRDLAGTYRAEHASQQQSVVRLKVQQINKWLRERTIDAELLASALRALPLDRLPLDRDTELAVQLLFADALAGNSERAGISLIAPDGGILVQAGEGIAADAETNAAAVALAANAELRQGIVDVHLAGVPPQPRMAFLVPIAARTGQRATTAVLAMSIDPFRGLFPQIVEWPDPSPSSETMVVRRDGGDVVFLIPPPLLNPVPKPLEFRAPLAGSKLPAAEAVLHGDGTRAGPDYRGVEVSTVSRRVSGVPWTVVGKTDVAEIMQPLQEKARTLAFVIGAAILLAAFMVAVLWRGEYASLIAFNARQREERTAMTRHFEQLIRMARDIVLLVRPDGLIIEANQAAVAAYGYSADELRGLNIRDLQPPEELARFNAVWDGPDPADGVLLEGANRRKDGSVFPIEVSGRAIEVDGRIYRQCFIRDISRRKALENKVARLLRVRDALQAASSVLLRAREETELFQEMCEILVQLGGYRMACVGLPNRDADKTVRFPAVAGADDGYLDRAGASWGEGPRSAEPSGGALRTGEVHVTRNFSGDPTMARWREAAFERNYRAGIGLPLKIDGEVFACLAIYAEQADAFGEEEARLLFAIAEDVSYAVSRLRDGALPIA